MRTLFCARIYIAELGVPIDALHDTQMLWVVQALRREVRKLPKQIDILLGEFVKGSRRSRFQNRERLFCASPADEWVWQTKRCQSMNIADEKLAL